MALLTPAVLSLRRDPRLLKLPPYLSLLCIVVGIVWLLILPLDEYSRRTYISENAILPGQVHTYFGGSEHTVFRAYRHEVAGFAEKANSEAVEKIARIFQSQRLKVARQKYNYTAAGQTVEGENVYAILQGPRADATEAMVLVAPLRNTHGAINHSGVALALTIARYFKRWSIWSKDVIFLITPDAILGPQAWVDAYHDMQPEGVSPLPIKSGALQGAIAIDYPAGPGGHRFDKLHILYDGVNGQQPNLDLVNTVQHISSAHIGVQCTVQRMWHHTNSYTDRLKTVFNSIVSQGLGHATGPHSSFIPYHVDAITIQTVGDGWHDEMTLGRVVESSFRSINNLLEHLHQSFFFYMLLGAKRFVSIGTYLPAAMLLAVNFSITSVVLWVQSGRLSKPPVNIAASGDSGSQKPEVKVIQHGDSIAVVPAALLATEERRLLIPVAVIAAAHIIGLVPFYLFNNTPASSITGTFFIVSAVSSLLPAVTSLVLARLLKLHKQELALTQSFSLLLLGIAISALSTINFSLGLLTGLVAAPLSFVRPLYSRPAVSAALAVVLLLVSPPVVLGLASAVYTDGSGGGGFGTGVARNPGAGYPGMDGLKALLVEASFAWTVSGTWTAVVVWVVWWPAWFIGSCVAWVGAVGAADGEDGQSSS